MDAEEIGALQEMIATAEEFNNRPKYEIIKTFYTKDVELDLKIELLAVRWKNGTQVGLECRKMYFSKKKKIWSMGRQAKMGLEELDFIYKNYSEIRAILNNGLT